MKHINKFDEYDYKNPKTLNVSDYAKFGEEFAAEFLNILFKDKGVRIKNTFGNSSDDTPCIIDKIYCDDVREIIAKCKDRVNNVIIFLNNATIYYNGKLDIESAIRKASEIVELNNSMKKYNV